MVTSGFLIFRIDNPLENVVLLTIVPWYHAYGLMSTMNYILIKRKLVYLNGFNPVKYLSSIQEYKVSYTIILINFVLC